MFNLKIITIPAIICLIIYALPFFSNTTNSMVVTQTALTVDNIKEIKVYEASILIWFNEGAENNRPWDLTLEYASPQEAEDSYNDMLSVLREIRFKQANNVHRISTTDKED